MFALSTPLCHSDSFNIIKNRFANFSANYNCNTVVSALLSCMRACIYCYGQRTDPSSWRARGGESNNRDYAQNQIKARENINVKTPRTPDVPRDTVDSSEINILPMVLSSSINVTLCIIHAPEHRSRRRCRRSSGLFARSFSGRMKSA